MEKTLNDTDMDSEVAYTNNMIEPSADDFISPFGGPTQTPILDNISETILRWVVKWQIKREMIKIEREKIQSLGLYFSRLNNGHTMWQKRQNGDIVREKHTCTKFWNIDRHWKNVPKEFKLKDLI